MKKYLFNKRASIYEYTILIVVVIGAIIVMQPYFARGIMGRWKNAGDSFGFGRQYDSDATTVIESESGGGSLPNGDGSGSGGPGPQGPDGPNIPDP